MRLFAASRSVDSQRIKSPPDPLPHRELVGILRPESLIAAILRRAEPIVVLAATAGMGKSTLLRIFSNDKDVRLHTGLRSPAPLTGVRPRSGTFRWTATRFRLRTSIFVAKGVWSLRSVRNSTFKV
jgi:hypothetical protein